MSAARAVPSTGRSLRVLAVALGTQPLVVLVAVPLVLPPDRGASTLPVAALVVGLVAAGSVAAQAPGHRVAPLPAGLDEARAA